MTAQVFSCWESTCRNVPELSMLRLTIAFMPALLIKPVSLIREFRGHALQSSEGTDLQAAFENQNNCIWIFLDFVLNRRICQTLFRYHEDLAKTLLHLISLWGFTGQGKCRLFQERFFSWKWASDRVPVVLSVPPEGHDLLCADYCGYWIHPRQPEDHPQCLTHRQVRHHLLSFCSQFLFAAMSGRVCTAEQM